MKIMIVDDTLQDQEAAASAILSHYGEENCRLIRLDNGMDALSLIEDGQHIDIAVLDIMMEGMTGVSLAQRMRDAGSRAHIVFLTVSNDFAAQSYQVGAVSYILKPLQASSLLDVLRSIDKQMLDADTAGFLVRRKGSSMRILYRELMYVEVNKHQLRFRMREGATQLAHGSLKLYAPKLLSEARMIQPNQSYIINMDFIRSFGPRTVVMWDDEVISVPRDFVEFQHRCVRWMLSSSGQGG